MIDFIQSPLGFIVMIGLLIILIFVVIIRWILRIDKRVQLLKDIKTELITANQNLKNHAILLDSIDKNTREENSLLPSGEPE